MNVGDTVTAVKALANPGEVDYVEKGTKGIVTFVHGEPFPYAVDFDGIGWLVHSHEIELLTE